MQIVKMAGAKCSPGPPLHWGVHWWVQYAPACFQPRSGPCFQPYILLRIHVGREGRSPPKKVPTVLGKHSPRGETGGGRRRLPPWRTHVLSTLHPALQ